jgi:biopolymer transport protein ExbD
MAIKISDHPEQEVRIEIVPLIDVVFCILTFFILAAVTLTRQSAINVDLPRASTGATQMRKLLIVSVDPIGQTYIEKQPVSRDQLYNDLTKFRQTNPEGLMVLYASRAASYNDVVQVLDLLRSIGGDRVALATLPASTGSDNGQLPNVTPGLNNSNPTSPFAPLQSPNGSFNPNQPIPGLDTPMTQPVTGSNNGASSGAGSGATKSTKP